MTTVLLHDPLCGGDDVSTALREAGYEPRRFSADRVLGACCVLCTPDQLERALATSAGLPVVVLDPRASIAGAVQAMRRGAFDYLPCPLETTQLRASLSQTGRTAGITSDELMIGSCQAMQALFEQIERVANADSPVLILGESGTGKELVAKAIHTSSNRRDAPLAVLNCAAIPNHLIEAELFGSPEHDNKPLVDVATGGTLFLDEIAELPLPAQARLLNVCETKRVRLVATTHRNLETLTADGQFREDLYFRLNVLTLTVPPLRQRGEDILQLADRFLQRIATQLNRPARALSKDAQHVMLNYRWPGNVRELENAIERAVILSDGETISTAALAIHPSASGSEGEGGADPSQQISLEEYFVRFVLEHQDSLTETELAEKLGISRKSLWERRQRLNIPRKKTRKRGPRRENV